MKIKVIQNKIKIKKSFVIYQCNKGKFFFERLDKIARLYS